MKTIDEGRRRRDEGVNAASAKNEERILRTLIRFIDRLLFDVDRPMSLDDVDHVEETAGNKWRGGVILRLTHRKLIARAGIATSGRESRNGGIIQLWKVIDIAGLRAFRTEAETKLGRIPRPIEGPKVQLSLFDSSAKNNRPTAAC